MSLPYTAVFYLWFFSHALFCTVVILYVGALSLNVVLENTSGKKIVVEYKIEIYFYSTAAKINYEHL